MEARNLPRISEPVHIDSDSDDLQEFAEASIDLIESHLEHNHQEAYGLTDVEKSVDEVLDYENIRELDVRAQPLENPKVTLWLKECPVWANDAWTETFHPFGLNAFNGKVTVTLDVRPF